MKNRLGGLARRATYIQQLKDSKVPFLHLDAGDLFQAAYAVSEQQRPAILAAAEVYFEAYREMGLQAFNVGDRDLALGVDTLKSLAKKSPFPFLSANILGEDGKPVFQPSVILEAGGLKVGVVGVVTGLFVNRQKLEADEEVKIDAPEVAVKRELARLKQQGAELLVVLGHLNESEAERVARETEDLHFILGGQSMRMERVLPRVDGTWVADAYMRGKNISVIDVYVKNGSLDFVDRNARQSLERRKTQLDLQIRSRERSIEQAKENPARKGSVEYLQRNLVQLKTELQEVTMDLEDLEAPDPNASFVIWDLKGMDTSFADAPAIARMVEKYREVHPDPTKKKATARPGPRRTPPRRK